MRLGDWLYPPRTAWVLATLALLFPCLASAADWQDGDVIVRVQDQTITYGEFKESWLSSPLSGVDLDGPDGQRLKLEILKPLVDRKLMYLDAVRSGVATSPEFEKLIAPFASRGAQPQDLDAFRAMALAAAHFKATRARLTPKEEELQQLYNERTDITTLPEKIQLQICVVPDQALAEKVAAQARAGTNLNILIQQHSIVPTAKEDLGMVGWVARGEGDPALEEVAFSLDKGEIGGPVQAAKGWYVMRVLGRKAQYVRPFPEAKPILVKRVTEERMEAYLSDLAKEFKPVVDPAFLATAPAATTAPPSAPATSATEDR
jgi:hypothetical protein